MKLILGHCPRVSWSGGELVNSKFLIPLYDFEAGEL